MFEGVPTGAKNPTQVFASKPGMVSAMAGTSGALGERSKLATPKALSLPV